MRWQWPSIDHAINLVRNLSNTGKIAIASSFMVSLRPSCNDLLQLRSNRIIVKWNFRLLLNPLDPKASVFSRSSDCLICHGRPVRLCRVACVARRPPATQAIAGRLGVIGCYKHMHFFVWLLNWFPLRCWLIFSLFFVHSYRLWIPQRKLFEPNYGEFRHEEMENYNWNYLDQHLCGESEFKELIEVLLFCFCCWNRRLRHPRSNVLKTSTCQSSSFFTALVKAIKCISLTDRIISTSSFVTKYICNFMIILALWFVIIHWYILLVQWILQLSRCWHGLMLLWFTDLINVTEEVTIHRPNVSTLLSSAFIRGDLNAATRSPFIR